LGPVADPLLTLADDVIASSASLIVSDLREFPTLLRRSPETELQFLVAIPIKLRSGQSIGTLMLMDEAPRAFDSGDHAILQAVAQLITEALQPGSNRTFLTPNGFLSTALWRKWLEAELVRVACGRVVQLTRIETKRTSRAGTNQDALNRLFQSVPARSAISEIDQHTLIAYEVFDEPGARSNLERVMATLEATLGIAFSARVILAEIDLADRVYVLLDLSEALLGAARQRGIGARVQATLRANQMY
jgi:hypothetical protein